MASKATEEVLQKLLALEGRTLTPHQFQKILVACQSNPLPLYLKLTFDAAKTWHSYDPPDINVLQNTVTDTIVALFEKVERVHGKALVRCALGCLTIGKFNLRNVKTTIDKYTIYALHFFGQTIEYTENVIFYVFYLIFQLKDYQIQKWKTFCPCEKMS